MHIVDRLKKYGFCVLHNSFDAPSLSSMRSLVINQMDLMANTRPNPSARHIAGFHRYPTLEPLHQMVTSNAVLLAALRAIYGPDQFISIGLSDITVNRSQPWHTDLLRGQYSTFLTPEICWGGSEKPCLKALLYLQNSQSLRVVPGSHHIPVQLSDDLACMPGESQNTLNVKTTEGDIVLMDIRLVHRGSSEAELQKQSSAKPDKILISTVFGSQFSRLTHAMQVGNAHRTADWDRQNLDTYQEKHTCAP